MKRKSYTILASLFLLALLVFCSANAIENCGPTPRDYQQHEYGDALFSIWSPCRRTLSPKEQVFVAGVSQYLLTQCRYPADIQARLKLQRFLSSSAFVGSIGRQYGNPNLGEGLGDQAASMTAYAVGEATAKAIGCTEVGEHLAGRVVEYLDRTAGGSPNAPNYVEECASYYSGRYTKQQCQCLADIGRSVFPNIHQTPFSSASIKRIIQSNPLVGLQIAFQCQIGDY